MPNFNFQAEVCQPMEFAKKLGERSIEQVSIVAGQDLIAGTVLGKIVASGKCVILTPGATDGSQNAAAILGYPTAATTGTDQLAAAVVRDADVNAELLTWPAGITAPQKAAAIAQLLAREIILR